MKSKLLAGLAAATLSLPAAAGEDAHPAIVLAVADAARETADAWQRWAEDFSREMRASMGTMFGPRLARGKVVKGAPYSAEVITETNQALADGNVISRRTTGAVYRDGEGRTRQETGGEGKQRTVYISDPVAHKSYVLTPGGKRAIAMPQVATMVHDKDKKEKRVIRLGSTEVRIEDGKVFVDGRQAEPGRVEFTSKSGKKIVVEDGKVTIDGKEVVQLDGGSGSTIRVERHVGPDGVSREEVQVKVVRAGDDKAIPVPPVAPMAPMPPGAMGMPVPPMPGVHTMRFESIARLGKGVTTSLGMKDFETVKAEGKSTVWTIPAGEIGNRNPINITSETWYSPDLQLTVMSRYHDPRTGESIYRLAGIRRGEPAADLFQVPDDYTVRNRGRAPSAPEPAPRPFSR